MICGFKYFSINLIHFLSLAPAPLSCWLCRSTAQYKVKDDISTSLILSHQSKRYQSNLISSSLLLTNMNPDPTDLIFKHIPERENYIVGYANLTGLLQEIYAGHPYAIIIGKKLDDGIIERIDHGPTGEYLNLYVKENAHLDEVGAAIVAELQDIGFSAVLVKASAPKEELGKDYDVTLRSDFPHKTAAPRAGLGWIGKTALLVSEEFGPRVRFVTVLTDKPVGKSRKPIDESKCGSCKLCVVKCPANAATGKSWTVDVDRDEFYNAFKCRQKCKELTKEMTGREGTICGICVSVSPFGKKRDKSD